MVKYTPEHITKCIIVAGGSPDTKFQRDEKGNLILRTVISWDGSRLQPIAIGEELPQFLSRRVVHAMVFPADRIKQLRVNLGMSQTELAERLSISKQTCTAWETGATLPHAAHQKALRELEQTALSEPVVATPIHELRRKLHLTLKDFAASYNVSVTTIKRWESGKSRPGPKYRAKLAAAWQAVKAKEADDWQQSVLNALD